MFPPGGTRAMTMLELYLEQQAAVFSALPDRSVKRNMKDIVPLSDEDGKVAEDIIQVLKPLNMVPALLSTEQLPTVSVIMPLKHTILESMKVSDTDPTVGKDVKSAILSDFMKTNPESDSILVHFLHMSTTLDPRLRSLPFLDETMSSNIFNSLMEKILENNPQQASQEQVEVLGFKCPEVDGEVPPQISSCLSPFLPGSKENGLQRCRCGNN
ncbi:zinc finger BED domain-containing protein 1-like [Mastacembelus armatus]|uniref:zinc finger BED domain-containing protein 1-like n=1 Tax=Mastacembelus armatus TaxID=205130 RepID=UPI000E45B4AD|nr:zinc finger BED domain-containing protein 1-like [Mastacembelus armatus]